MAQESQSQFSLWAVAFTSFRLCVGLRPPGRFRLLAFGFILLRRASYYCASFKQPDNRRRVLCRLGRRTFSMNSVNFRNTGFVLGRRLKKTVFLKFLIFPVFIKKKPYTLIVGIYGCQDIVICRLAKCRTGCNHYFAYQAEALCRVWISILLFNLQCYHWLVLT